METRIEFVQIDAEAVGDGMAEPTCALQDERERWSDLPADVRPNFDLSMAHGSLRDDSAPRMNLTWMLTVLPVCG